MQLCSHISVVVPCHLANHHEPVGQAVKKHCLSENEFGDRDTQDPESPGTLGHSGRIRICIQTTFDGKTGVVGSPGWWGHSVCEIG